MTFDLLSAARDLIAADSVSARGNLRAVEVLEKVAHSLGLETYRQEAEALGTAQANLVVHPRGAPPTDGSLLLVTHTDTVGSGPLELWTKTNPWVLAQDEDTLYGLGVADVKLDALAKLQALASAPPEAAGKVAFLGTFAEEVGCLGAKHFVRYGRFRPAWASCGEPSELRIIDAHKGYLVANVELIDPGAPDASAERLRLTFGGQAAHSSTPHLGVNAIDRAFAFCSHHGVEIEWAEGGDLANKVPARCVVEVPALPGLDAAAIAEGVAVEKVRDPKRSIARALEVGRRISGELRKAVLESPPKEDSRFDPATAVFNNGVVRSDGNRLEFTCDARLLPGHDPVAIFDRIEAAGGQLARTFGLTMRIDRARANPAMALPAKSRLRDAAMETSRALGLNPSPQAKPTNTEGGVFVSAGIEAIVFGPGRSTGNAHTANEWQSLSQLQDAARWYAQLVRNLCA
ncbi:M20/M25/M40 family metallo-hydrolase [Vulgatibacter incomptus]|uniref:Acetylornithine deacetylase n=1 Tax=Vulgatibacter incomptus TaxID=1391653 RepID=A0A0K1PFK1_9BACT|nr:M20/M25/M40 family metallo-hydrolase [Vulgatibacter incomptus]AKU92308.1 Acetylornithine deacetylase [Vulgatibacter incomptus]